MPPCSLGIAIRNTSDVCIRTNRLHFGSALRIIDHHLHVSGIIPPAASRSPKQMYDHEWFCVSQSVTTPTTDEQLWKLSLQDRSDTAQVHTWISKTGKSSLQFASSINATGDNNICMGMAKRVFVRRSLAEKTAAPFSEDELKRFHRFMYDNNMQILPDLSDLAVQDFMTAPLQTSDNKSNHPAVLQVPIGPQHVNLAHHVDHAFLAETAAHAFWKAGISEEERNHTLKIQYVAEGNLGKTLQCHVVDKNVVCLYQHNNQDADTNKMDDGLKLVAVAEKSSSQDKKLHSRHY